MAEAEEDVPQVHHSGKALPARRLAVDDQILHLEDHCEEEAGGEGGGKGNVTMKKELQYACIVMLSPYLVSRGPFADRRPVLLSKNCTTLPDRYSQFLASSLKSPCMGIAGMVVSTEALRADTSCSDAA